MTAARLKQDGENFGFPSITVSDVAGDKLTIGEAKYERGDTPVMFVQIDDAGDDDALSVHLSLAGVAAVHAALGLWLEHAGAPADDED